MTITSLIALTGKAMGVAALAGVHAISLSGPVTAIGLHGTGYQYAEPMRMRMAEGTDLGAYMSEDGFDGNVFWNRDRKHVVWNDGSDAGRSAEIDQTYLADYDLWAPNADGAKLVLKAPNVLDVTPRGSKVAMTLTFDPKTHLLVKVVQPTAQSISTTTMTAYAPYKGVMIPRSTHNDTGDGNAADAKITDIAFNPGDAATRLARPTFAATDFSIAGGATSTTVPTTLSENHTYLNVMLNGKGPYHFIFDTGGANIIDPQVAKDIGALSNGSYQGGGVGEQTESASFAHVKTLQVGDATLTEQDFSILPTRQGFGMSAGQPVDGLIGWEVLARFVTTFDYANHQVVFTLPNAAQPIAGADVIPMTFFGTQPQVPCTLNEIPSECTIDTGARDTISLYTPYLQAHPQVKPQTETAVGVNGYGVGGPALGNLGRLRSFSMGQQQLPDLIADYSTQRGGAMTAPFLAANLGGELLRRFAVTFDYGRGTMSLVRNATYGDRDTAERSGLFVLNKSGAYVIADARPGTPAADAGLVKGDTIESVDGVASSSLSLQELRAYFEKPAGSLLTLGIVGKDGAKRNVTLTLRDYI